MVVRDKNAFLQTLLRARKLSEELYQLKSVLLDNSSVDFEDIPFDGVNSDTLAEAIQCFIDYGELPPSDNLEDFWDTYEKAIQGDFNWSPCYKS